MSLRFMLALVTVMAALLGSVPASAATGSPGAGRAGEMATASALQATAVTLRPGARGSPVRALQQRLVQLRYWLGPVDGIYGYQTTQAVLAFQKVNGLARDGIAGPKTLAALKSPIRPKPRSTARLVVEVVKSKQVVLLVRSGKVDRIFNASTGTSRTPTPSGTYRVVRQINGWRDAPLGRLYRPKYFYRGYALHGSTSVPAYPASHGCVRVSLWAMDYLWSRVPVGSYVRSY